MQRAKRSILVGVITTMLMITGMAPAVAQASERRAGEAPTEMAVLGDIIVARPLMAAVSFGGLVVFTGTLPFTALGDNVDEMAEKMVRAPARTTFLRCLGCTPAQHERRQLEKRTRAANR